MPDEIKKKSAPGKDGKPEAKPEASADKSADKPATKPAAKADGEPRKTKESKKAPAPPADASASAAEAAKPAEGAALVAAVAAPTAAELLADDMAGKKIVKAKGSKNIVSGSFRLGGWFAFLLRRGLLLYFVGHGLVTMLMFVER